MNSLGRNRLRMAASATKMATERELSRVQAESRPAQQVRPDLLGVADEEQDTGRGAADYKA
jgi:hypothetical protein